LFSDAEAARKIFERWRERFGSVDEQDEIYVAVVRGISPKEPAHYRVMITSRLASEANSSDGRHLLIPSRIQTMQAASDINLNRFLESYREAGAYLLAPAIVKGDREPEFLFDVAVLKRELSVKLASEVGEQDIEAMALGPALD
jgi:hypothetical protein